VEKQKVLHILSVSL